MEIIYTKILKVDPATGQIAIAAFADAQNLTLYLEGILNEIANNEGDREYEFDQDKLTTRTYISRVVGQDNPDDASVNLASKLASVESDAQDRVNQMGVVIQRGVLIVSYVKMTETENKLIISKADYTKLEFEAQE